MQHAAMDGKDPGISAAELFMMAKSFAEEVRSRLIAFQIAFYNGQS
jgi:hypothetical protein